MEDGMDHYKKNSIIKTESAKPIKVYCHKCGCDDFTDCQVKNSAYAYGGCTLIFCLGGVLGCCLIPFCFDQCKDANHFCTRCGTELAYKKAFKKDVENEQKKLI